MNGTNREPRRRGPQVSRKRSLRPVVEGLEERMLLFATNGGLWQYPVRITVSLVPDGTSVGGVPSNLYATLNAVAAPASWQAAFQKAAALWSAYANLNLAFVPDNGAPLGSAGDQQGDPNFGDIRIGMIPQQGGVLAYAMLPPPINGGSDAGDIVFNSNNMWGVNTNIDVETVALHEIGHALGMDHTPVSNAVMNAYYNGLNQTPVSDDISGIQSVYGAQPADTDTNRSFSTATNITGLTNANGQIAIGNLRIAGTSDNDYFYVTAPANTTGTMTVSVQSTNLSSLSPSLTIWNSAYHGLFRGALYNTFGGTKTFTVTGVTPGQGFYIDASAAGNAGGIGSYGAYGLLVSFGSQIAPPIAPPNTVVASQPDIGWGGSLALNSLGSGVSTDGSTFQGFSFNVHGTTVGLNDLIDEMKSAEATLSSNPFVGSMTILADTTLLMESLHQHHADSSEPFQELQAVINAAKSRDIGAGITALNTFFGNVFQAGGMAAYGDAMTVSSLRQEQRTFLHSASALPTAPTATQVPAFAGPTHDAALAQMEVEVQDQTRWVKKAATHSYHQI